MRLSLVVWVAALTAGCGGPVTLAQRLEGDWLGRPETERERVLREWPGGATEDDVAADPELARALAEAEPVDLATFAEARVAMRLGVAGDAELTLGGETVRGRWEVSAGEAGDALLEIEVDRDANLQEDPQAGDQAPSPDGVSERADSVSPATEMSAGERRRFVVQFLKAGGGFTLVEQGADRRFGRLLFIPPAAE